MPIYEYQCQSCQKTFETITLSASSARVECAHCGSDNVEKLISAPGKAPGSTKGDMLGQCQSRGGFS